MTARLGEGGFDDERRMCDEETSSEGDKNTELNVEAAVCSGTECCPCVSACLCVCGHVRKKNSAYTFVPVCLHTYWSCVFRRHWRFSLLHCRRRGTTAVLSVRFSRLYQQTLIKTSSPSLPTPAAARLAAMQMQALRKQPVKPCAGRPCSLPALRTGERSTAKSGFGLSALYEW